MLTQLTKGVPGVRRLPTQLWSYLLALATLVLSRVFSEGFRADSLVLCLFNGALVSLAANGGYAALSRLKEGLTSQTAG